MRARSLALVALSAAACGQQLNAPPLAHLDRPSDISFGCAADVTSTGGEVTTTAIPASACAGVTAGPDGGTLGVPDAPAGTGITGIHPVGFVLETARGDLSVGDLTGQGSFKDNDVFTPGLNGIPVGRLPIGVATSANGCFAVVANAGSCDLALVNVGNAYRALPNSVRRQIMSSSKGRLAAKPSAILAPPSAKFDGTVTDCSAPAGVVYVSFSSCHLVARVDLATGNILDGVQYRAGQPPIIVGPDVTCPVECTELPTADEGAGDAGVASSPDARPAAADAGTAAGDAGSAGPDAGASAPQILAQPITVDMDPDGDRMYIGAFDSPTLVAVDLGDNGAMTGVETLGLEGAGGITRLATTGEIPMGNNGGSGLFRFVYAIGRDGAIHVADVTPGRAPEECETQLDRRFLHSFTSVSRTACFPVGASDNPPRRADAKGPGIRLPAGVAPLDLAFIKPSTALVSAQAPSPSLMNGVFAVVSAVGPLADSSFGRGVAYVINVNDQNYPDTPGANFPFCTSGCATNQKANPALVFPHALREGNTSRIVGDLACSDPSYATGTIGPVRIAADPTRSTIYTYNDFGGFDSPFAPSLHRVFCDAAGSVPVWELSVIAPPAQRDALFPDLGEVGVRSADPSAQNDEQIVISWEGPLAGQVADSRKSGAQMTVGDQQMTLHAPGALLCALGAENGDIVTLLGCLSDGDCGPGESCVVHPDSPAGTPGMCLPTANVTQLESDCREIMITQRRYTVIEMADEHAVLAPRYDILYATPIEGCTDDAQCTAIEDYLVAQAEASASAGTTVIRHSYTCDADPGRGGSRQCITTCTTDDDCQSGAVCDGGSGRCVLGVVPPPQCLAPSQIYEVLSGNSFSIVSSNGEFKSRQRVDAKTGLCVADTTLSPLLLNRFHRVEPPCTDLTAGAVTPNPCYLPDLQEPIADSSGYTTRPAYGIRVRSPGVTLDITDIGIPFPAAANLPGVLYSPVNLNYTMALQIAGGFLPFAVPLDEALPARVRRAPDGTLWIVDSGDLPNGITTGQVVQMGSTAVLTSAKLL